MSSTGTGRGHTLARVGGFATLLLLASALGGFGWIWWTQASLDCRVGVFMYHAVVPDSFPATRFEIRHSDFVRHLDELKAEGVPVVLPELRSTGGSLAEQREEWCSTSNRVAMITFDAEIPSFHSTLSVPALESREMPAAYFVVTGHLDLPGWVSRDDIAAMHAAGMMVGSHSHTHPLFTRVSNDSVGIELTSSQATLHELGIDAPHSLAFPGGRYDSDILGLVDSLEFEYAFTSDPCYLDPLAIRHSVCRIEVRGDRTLSPLGFLRSPQQVTWQSWVWRAKRLAEKVLPERLWDASRAYLYR